MSNVQVQGKPRMLAMTVVTSKLQASAAIMTPPGSPSTRKRVSASGAMPCQIAVVTVALVTCGLVTITSCNAATRLCSDVSGDK